MLFVCIRGFLCLRRFLWRYIIPVSYHVRHAEGFGDVVEGERVLDGLADVAAEGGLRDFGFDVIRDMFDAAKGQGEAKPVIGVSGAAEEAGVGCVAECDVTGELGAVFEVFFKADLGAGIFVQESADFGG